MDLERKKPKGMVYAERNVTIRDFLIFQVKLLLDGAKDGVLIVVSIGAILLDVLSGKGKRPRLFYSVMRLSERFDLWINLNGAMEELEKGETDEGLLGTSQAGGDTLLGKIGRLVRPPKKPIMDGDSDPTEPDV